ncbi:MAG: hypothetical protein FWF44_03305 [Defluviitaleaceae bacterium]|nr:hypothetical protein [Defluviitaleaceae bacterium]
MTAFIFLRAAKDAGSITSEKLRAKLGKYTDISSFFRTSINTSFRKSSVVSPSRNIEIPIKHCAFFRRGDYQSPAGGLTPPLQRRKIYNFFNVIAGLTRNLPQTMGLRVKPAMTVNVKL